MRKLKTVRKVLKNINVNTFAIHSFHTINRKQI